MDTQPLSTNICPKCHASLPPDAPQGLCPKCLFAAVATPTEAGQPDGHRAKPPPLEEIAAAFPQLEILEFIGQGGMGFVFKARQPKLDRLVALKILPQSLAADPTFAERFNREAKLLARLNHPGIVTVHDFGVASHQPSTLNPQPFYYLLMEFVDGVNLRQAMQAGRFTPDQALAIVPKICEALQFAHNEGILHRDIKPENILLDAKGRVKLADFGIAKLVGDVGQAFQPAGAGDFPVASSEAVNTGLESPVNRQAGKPALRPDALTEAGKTLGTPNYMAPEQLANAGDVDHRADIYSLGVVFYEMLTGELPRGQFAPPSQKSAADPRVDEVVLRALEKEKTKRPASADEVRTQVESITGSAAAPPVFRSSGRESAPTESSAKPESQSRLTSAATNQEPRFSRTAIVGACLGFIHAFLLPLVHYRGNGDFTSATFLDHPPYRFLVYPEWALFVGSLIAMTILGWKAVGQIRRSGGRVRGLWLALFDGLLLPVFIASVACGIGVNILLAGCSKVLWSITGRNPHLGMNHWMLLILCAVILTPIVFRFMWRKVNQPLAGPHISEPPKPTPDRTPASETKSTPLGKWALGLFIGAVVGTPLLWGFMGAQEVIVLCGLTLLLSLALGVMGWRSQSGKFAALASGLGLLLLMAFTVTYIAPRYPARGGSTPQSQVAQDKLPNRVLFTFSHDGNRKPMIGQRIALPIKREGDTGWQPANGQAMRLADGRTVLFKVRAAQSEAAGIIVRVATKKDNEQDWQENDRPLSSNGPATFTFANGLRVNMSADHSDERANPNDITMVPVPDQSQARKAPAPSGILTPAIGIGALLMVSLALGVLGWRTRSGKVVALASGLGLVVWVAFIFNYQTSPPPRGPYEGGGKTTAYTQVKDNLFAAMSARYGAKETRFELGKPIDVDLLFYNYSPIDVVVNPQELPPTAWLTVTDSAGNRVELTGKNEAARVLKEPRVIKTRDGTGGYAMSLLLLPKNETYTAPHAKADAVAWVEPGTYDLQFRLRLPRTSYRPGEASKDEYHTVMLPIEVAGTSTSGETAKPAAGPVVERVKFSFSHPEALSGGHELTLPGNLSSERWVPSTGQPISLTNNRQVLTRVRLLGSSNASVNAEAACSEDGTNWETQRLSLNAAGPTGKLWFKNGTEATVELLGAGITALSQPPTPSFSPVIERELRLDDEVLAHGLDFATGKLTALTRTEYNRTADDGTDRKLYRNMNDWVNATGVDMIFGGDTNRFSMAGLESEFKMSALPTEAWATATEVELKAALAQARMQREYFNPRFLPPRDKNWDFLVISNDAQFRQTYAVQARDTYGVLEITAVTENPRGMKFRYKLVQSAAPVKPAQKKQYELSVQFGFAADSPVIKKDVELGMPFNDFKSAGDHLYSISGQIDAPKNGKFPGTITLGDYSLSEAHKGTGHQGAIPVELELGKPFNHTVILGIAFIRIITLTEKATGTAQLAEPQAGNPVRVETITIAADGALTAAGEPCPVDQLAGRLKQLAARQLVSVEIRADKAAPFKSVVAVMDACKAAGIARVSTQTPN